MDDLADLRDRVRTVIEEGRAQLRREHGYVPPVISAEEAEAADAADAASSGAEQARRRNADNAATRRPTRHPTQRPAEPPRPCWFLSGSSTRSNPRLRLPCSSRSRRARRCSSRHRSCCRPSPRTATISLGTVGWISTAQLAGFVLSSWSAEDSSDRFDRCSSPVRSSACSRTSRRRSLPTLLDPVDRTGVQRRVARSRRMDRLAGSVRRQRANERRRRGRSARRHGRLTADCVADHDDRRRLVVRRARRRDGHAAVLRASGADHRPAATSPDTPRRDSRRTSDPVRARNDHDGWVVGVRVRRGDRHPAQRALAVTVSLLFSANAIAGIPAARWSGRRGPAGMWFIGTATCAVLIASIRHDVVFVVGLVGWGFVFFMGVPAVVRAARVAFGVPGGTGRRRTGGDGARTGVRSADRRRTDRPRFDHHARLRVRRDHRQWHRSLLLYADRHYVAEVYNRATVFGRSRIQLP